jgi:serine/threonine-protein kinase
MAALSARWLADGRYTLLERIGRGALGEVWLAFDRCLQRQVALKRSRIGAPAARQRLLAEAHAMAQLDHPAIASLLELVDEDTPTPFFTMRRIEGRPFSEWLTPYPATQAQLASWLPALASVASALAHAHARGWVHGDIKPDQLVGQSDDMLVITDWGMVRPVQAALDVACHGPIGTPQYMAPEQLEGYIDMASDIFGLGGVLYRLLTGKPPYDWPPGILPPGWQQVVADAAIQAIPKSGATAHQALRVLCTQALSADRSRRPRASVMARCLREAASSLQCRRRWWFR